MHDSTTRKTIENDDDLAIKYTFASFLKSQMNLILLPAQSHTTDWIIDDPRQVQHIQQQLKSKRGDTLKIGIQNQGRYRCQICDIQAHQIKIRPLHHDAVPHKIPVTLMVALPRPKALRRLIMDATSLGVEKIVLFHSYHVEKSYWQTPYLQQLQHYMQLGLEQAGDVFFPEIQLEKRFKPFVEDRLSTWAQHTPTFVAHPYATATLPVRFNQPCQIMLGAERGFIDYELDLLQKNGCQIVQLGNRILRTETAMAAVLARLFA